MKPFHKLSTVKKAKMVHGLFPAEISDFIAYLKSVALETVDDNEEFTRVWEKLVLVIRFWVKLVLGMRSTECNKDINYKMVICLLCWKV